MEPVYKRVDGDERAALMEEVRRLEARLRSKERHIHALHGYNEVKDVCQELLGKLAARRGVLVRSLYPDFGLSLEN